jgi:hypothetical protein
MLAEREAPAASPAPARLRKSGTKD